VLASRRKQMAGTLSGGEQQMLAVARALMSRPRLLCATSRASASPLIVREVFNVLQRVNTEQQMAMLIVEQNGRDRPRIASRAYLLEAGEVVSRDANHCARATPVRRAYLGY